MGWGIFRKIKDGIKKAGRFIKDRVIKPIAKPENVRKVIDTGIKLAPLIGAGVSTAYTGNPQAGMMIGSKVQNVGNQLGFG